MPKNLNLIGKREELTYERFVFIKEHATALLALFEYGVRTPNALALVFSQSGYRFSGNRMANFYNFKTRDREMLNAVKDVLEKIEMS